MSVFLVVIVAINILGFPWMMRRSTPRGPSCWACGLSRHPKSLELCDCVVNDLPMHLRCAATMKRRRRKQYRIGIPTGDNEIAYGTLEGIDGHPVITITRRIRA